MDLGVPEPGTEAGVQELYRREILEDDSFKKQGRMCKLGAWFDFIRACDEWTKRITARRYHMVVISENLMGTDQAQVKMKKAAEELAKSMPPSEPSAATASGVVGEQNEKGDGKAAHRQQMRDLKKRLGNMMLLSPCLLHSFNACNMNIMLAVGRLLWSEQTYLAVKKGTGHQDALWHSQSATGFGTHLLRQLWSKVVGNKTELARIGIQAVDGVTVSDFSGRLWTNAGILDDIAVQDQDEIVERLMSLILHTLESCGWSAAWNECAMPEMLSAFMAPNSVERDKQVKYTEDLWHASVAVESEQGTGSGPQELRNQIYWLDWPAVQWVMRLLSHFHFQRHPTLESIIRSLCTRMGDTKMIEEMFKHIRGAEAKQQDPNVVDILGLYQKAITNPTPLTQRDLPVLTVSQDEWYEWGTGFGPQELVANHGEEKSSYVAQSMSVIVLKRGVCIQDSCLRSAILDSSSVALPGISRGPTAWCGEDLADPGRVAACSHYPQKDKQGYAGAVVSEVRHADMASDRGEEATHRR